MSFRYLEKNTNTPILTCSNTADRLTVAGSNLTYKVGLLTYDEVAMAGADWSSLNSNFYLYNGQDYWLLSSSDIGGSVGTAYVGRVCSNGGLGSYPVNYTIGIRPALSLKNDTVITSGIGTSLDPYIVE